MDFFVVVDDKPQTHQEEESYIDMFFNEVFRTNMSSM